MGTASSHSLNSYKFKVRGSTPRTIAYSNLTVTFEHLTLPEARPLFQMYVLTTDRTYRFVLEVDIWSLGVILYTMIIGPLGESNEQGYTYSRLLIQLISILRIPKLLKTTENCTRCRSNRHAITRSPPKVDQANGWGQNPQIQHP